jgi:hypothetical protein
VKPADITRKRRRENDDGRVGLGWAALGRWLRNTRLTTSGCLSYCHGNCKGGGPRGSHRSSAGAQDADGGSASAQRHYVQFTKEDVKRALAVTGTQTTSLSRGGSVAWTGGW